MKKSIEKLVKTQRRIVAPFVSSGNPQRDARKRLLAARKVCTIRDVVSPVDAKWEVELLKRLR